MAIRDLISPTGGPVSTTTTQQLKTTETPSKAGKWGSFEGRVFKPSPALAQLAGGLIESLHDVVLIYSQLWLAPVNCKTFAAWLSSGDIRALPQSVVGTDINELTNFFKDDNPLQNWCKSWAPPSLQPYCQRETWIMPSSNPAVANVLYQLKSYTYYGCADILSCINDPTNYSLEDFKTMANEAYSSSSLIQLLGGGTEDQALDGLVTKMESLVGNIIDNLKADDKDIETEAKQELGQVETLVNQIREQIKTINQDISNIKRKIASLNEDIIHQCVELAIDFTEILLEDEAADAEAIADFEEGNGLFGFFFAFIKLLIDEFKLNNEEDKLNEDKAMLKNDMAKLNQNLEKEQELKTDIRNAFVLAAYLDHLGANYAAFQANGLEKYLDFVQDMFEPLCYIESWPLDEETQAEFRLRVSAVQSFCAMAGSAQWSWQTPWSSPGSVFRNSHGLIWKLSSKGLHLTPCGFAPPAPSPFPPLP